MNNLKQQLTQIFKTAFEKLGYENMGNIVNSEREDLADFQCNDCMQLAKIAKKAPIEIAKEVLEKLEKTEIISSVSVAGAGFINIKISDEFLPKFALNYMTDFKQNIQQNHTPKTVVIDYGGPNIAKPLHVGHLRSAIIGESIKRIAKFLGDKVIADVHVGDWGLQMGMIISEIKVRHPNLVYFDENFKGEYPKDPVIGLDELETLYPDASKKAKENPQFLEQARKATFDLQNGNRGYLELWKKFCEVSIESAKENYENLDVSFDLWNGESSCNNVIPDMIKSLKNKGFATESNGALIVDVSLPDDKAEIPPFILLKSDGAYLYSTTDLGTIIARQNEFNPDEMWYVADIRQNLHFTQVFRCAKKTGIQNANTTFCFVGFGTMNGKDGKPFKTRAGGTMKLSDLIADVKAVAQKKVEANFENRTDIEKNEISNIINCVSLATIKFADLSNYRTKDYVFDVDKFMEFEGKTGPYLLYTYARLNSLLEKNKMEKSNFTFGVYSNIERKLLLTILSAEESILKSYAEKAPNYISETVYKIANLTNTFYANTNLLKETDMQKKQSHITLCNLAKNTIATLLNLLGIKIVEKM